MEIKYRSKAALEVIARKALNSYDPMLLSGPPSAIPIEKLARKLGLSIEFQCLRKSGWLLGEMVYDKTYVPVYFRDLKKYELIHVNGKTIILDESLLCEKSEGRLRFTCAHEISHWLLHKEIYSGTGQTATFIDLKKSSEENTAAERQANQLATILLMPTVQVKKAYRGMRNNPDPSTPLAELFGVSKQAMGIFLREHNLI